jgi:HEPN domain-containing protein
MRAELEIARQWVAKARNDLLDADNNLASAQVPTDTVCFHCQQAAEKLLKAVLAAQGVPPPRTHVLMLLADQLTASFPTVEQLADDLAILTPYAVAARYPDDDFDTPTIEDAREARQCAERVLTWLREECPELM